MKTPFRPIPTLALALLLAAIPTTLLAGPPRPGSHRGGPRGGFMAEHMAERLELTDEQREQIRAIHEGHREETDALIEALSAARRDLGSAVHADLFDETAIRTAAGRVAGVEADLAVKRALLAGEVRQILTPDQYEKAREMREIFQDLAGALHERRHGGHRPQPFEGD